MKTMKTQPPTSPNPLAMFRSMWPTDMKQVMLIERACFGKDSWDEKDFSICFPTRTKHFGYVAEMAGRIVGYAVARQLNVTTLIIENMGVDPRFRFMGVGRLLVERVEKSAMEPKRLRALIRESNVDAQLFFRSIGWRATGMDPRPWSGVDEDGIQFFKRVLRERR